jgi:acyl-homoserine lactone acylase PvdQ
MENYKNGLKLTLLFLFELQVFLKPQNTKRKTRKAATQVTIIRDNWSIPHVYGKTDADAVLACYTHNVKMISCALK